MPWFLEKITKRVATLISAAVSHIASDKKPEREAINKFLNSSENFAAMRELAKNCKSKEKIKMEGTIKNLEQAQTFENVFSITNQFDFKNSKSRFERWLGGWGMKATFAFGMFVLKLDDAAFSYHENELRLNAKKAMLEFYNPPPAMLHNQNKP